MGWSCLDDRDRLLDIVEHGQEAVALVGGRSLEAFQADRTLQLATERLLEIIGEAAGALSDAVRQRIPIDWRRVRGMRNVLAHQYGNVDTALVYRAVCAELPELVAAVQEAISE